MLTLKGSFRLQGKKKYAELIFTPSSTARPRSSPSLQLTLLFCLCHDVRLSTSLLLFVSCLFFLFMFYPPVHEEPRSAAEDRSSL